MSPAAKDRVGPHDLGIDLSAGADAEVFKWLIACQLFGARIKQEIAAETFRVLDRDGVVTPRKLADAGWQHLVDLLGEGGYRRYDESTARALIANGKLVVDTYQGKLSQLPEGVRTKKEIAARLQEFEGVGPKAAEIFLREMKTVWAT